MQALGEAEGVGAEQHASDVQALYQGQCVGTQGWQYRSHSQWVDWQSSITRSASLAQNLMPENYNHAFAPTTSM